MAHLRHIAITVNDLEKAASFYENVFELKRVRAIPNILIALTDGVINITLIKYETDEMAGDERGKDFVGLHHMGFLCDDLDAQSRQVEAAGAELFMDAPVRTSTEYYEKKYRDPNGVIFDITHSGWHGVKA